MNLDDLTPEEFKPDDRVEDTLLEVLTYCIATGIANGTVEQEIKFVKKILSIPTFQLFNLNALAMVESDIVSNAVSRDFVLNLFSKFHTTMLLRFKDYNIDNLIRHAAAATLTVFNIGTFDSNQNKQLIHSLKKAILPIAPDQPQLYLKENKWYTILVLLNVFSIPVLKVMDDLVTPTKT